MVSGHQCCQLVPGLSCVVAQVDRILLIYPLKLRTAGKFKGVIHGMAEAAARTGAVPLNQRLAEGEGSGVSPT